jgi:hypothetical protein
MEKEDCYWDQCVHPSNLAIPPPKCEKIQTSIRFNFINVYKNWISKTIFHHGHFSSFDIKCKDIDNMCPRGFTDKTCPLFRKLFVKEVNLFVRKMKPYIWIMINSKKSKRMSTEKQMDELDYEEFVKSRREKDQIVLQFYFKIG